jgi:hypothetical protein
MKVMNKKAVHKAFTEFVWVNNREPNSIAEFCEFAQLEPIDFKVSFQSFKHLSQDILTDVLNDVLDRVEKASEEHDYSNREKCLALFFTLVEGFGEYKSYLNTRYGLKNVKSLVEDWRPFNQLFVEKTTVFLTDDRLTWIREKLPSKLTSEVNGLLLGWNYVFRVWLADESEDQSITDAAIEKTVHMYFDFAHTDQLEKLLDFGKFVATTKVNW